MDNNYVLSITGSDNTCTGGIQADAMTIAAMGGKCLTAITAIVIQNEEDIIDIQPLSNEIIMGQVRTGLETFHPHVAKVGLICSEKTIYELSRELIKCRQVIVSPGFISSNNYNLIDKSVQNAIMQNLLPIATLLMLRCNEAEVLLQRKIKTDDDMLQAARSFVDNGAEWVLLRDCLHSEGAFTTLLYNQNYQNFFTFYNIEGWLRHGVGNSLSTAIATRLAQNDDMRTAVKIAHNFVNNQIVYKVGNITEYQHRPTELYNQFLSLIASHYTEAHNVAFYSDKMAITTRYLFQITQKCIGKSPKEIIIEYLVNEAKKLIRNTSLTMQEISIKLGFPSQNAFSKFFKDNTYSTPMQYRKL